MQVEITKTVNLPDTLRMELFRRIPELGPKILFFSGGTALRGVSAELVYYTHSSIHIITPIDSGGSSAVLRDAFGMPAIGDIRNRYLTNRRLGAKRHQDHQLPPGQHAQQPLD